MVPSLAANYANDFRFLKALVPFLNGIKWCGKTWTSRHHAKSAILMFHSTGEIKHKKIIDKKICIGYAKITDYLKFIVLRRNGRRNLHLKNLRFFKLLPYFRKD